MVNPTSHNIKNVVIYVHDEEEEEEEEEGLL